MSTGLNKLLAYRGLVIGTPLAHFDYAFTQISQAQERETFLIEIGEGLGEIVMCALIYIYFTTPLRLIMRNGTISKLLSP